MNKYLVGLIKYSCSFIVATGIFFLCVCLRNLFSQNNLKEIYRILADGFTIPCIVFLGVGLLLILSNFGALRGIGYAMKHLAVMLIPFMKKKHETYADYCERKKPLKGFGFIFVTSGVLAIPTIIFTILFYTV
ncbi:MAG: DUF3899 domain-containing protein [Bacilli bacterium]|nr:DUF3899 domain-containing protein [Bacilli bacterium]